jgi:hypothetical protein
MKTLKKLMIGIIVVAIIAIIVSIVLIPIGLSLNLAYFEITGSFLGLENTLADLSKHISFWLLIFIFTISTVLMIISLIESPAKSFAIIFTLISFIATFGAIEIVEITINSANLERPNLFENILKSVVYTAGTLSILNHLDDTSED